jgi:hypothetical protein
MMLPRAIFWIAGGVAAAVVAGIAAGPVLSRVEQPDYKVENQDGSIEIRSYGPMIAAEAQVQGERKSAINEGFRLIAGYIFGKNEPQAKIEMTAPVEQQKSQKIAMTSPVTQQGQENSWTVRFIMPKSWTMQTLPAPSDPRVKLEPLPARRFLVVTFSGLARDDAIESRTAELRRYAASNKLATVGEPLLAFYNPPWTLPMLRRNEIMLELA